MASLARVGTPITLEEFLRLPEQKPVLEFIDGRIEAKVSPQTRHSVLTLRLMDRLNAFGEPLGLGLALPEPRCTFDGRSIVPDVTFLAEAHIPLGDNGEYRDEVHRPPDLHIEILSPDQSARRCREKLVHSTSHGCPLGWFIDPDRRVVELYRDGQAVVVSGDHVLEGDPVLPGFRLPVSELFGWLVHPRRADPGTTRS